MDTVFKTNRQTNKNHHMQTSSWGKSGKKGTNVSFSKYKKITLKKKNKTLIWLTSKNHTDFSESSVSQNTKTYLLPVSSIFTNCTNFVVEQEINQENCRHYLCSSAIFQITISCLLQFPQTTEIVVRKWVHLLQVVGRMRHSSDSEGLRK